MYDDLIVDLTLEQVVKYLERIELFEKAQQLSESLTRTPGFCPFDLTVELLDELVYSHQLTVPFENLEIHDLHNPVLLGTEALFDKIVNRRRGGYCFELNKSFNSLLRAFGYQTTSHLGRIQRFPVRAAESDERISPGPPSHRINLVTIYDGNVPKRYLADVSFGGSQPASGMLLEVGEHQDQLGGQFNFYYGIEDEARGITDETWLLTRISSSGEELSVVSFEEFRQLEANFVTPNYFTSSNPTSHFVTGRTVNIRRRDGHALVSGDVFRLTSDGETTEIEISDPEVRAGVFMEYFGIVL